LARLPRNLPFFLARLPRILSPLARLPISIPFGRHASYPSLFFGTHASYPSPFGTLARISFFYLFQLYSHILFYYIFVRLSASGTPSSVEDEEDMSLEAVIARMRSQANLADYLSDEAEDEGDFSS
jgi:hypothetical protein